MNGKGKTVLRLDRDFVWDARSYVMGILNLTPDSFSGDGLFTADDVIRASVDQAERFLAEGAHILDLGGESTRPGAAPVSVQEETDRVVPVILAIRQARPDAILSIDTSKAAVAAAALDAGAAIVNDVWAMMADPEMAGVVARYGCPVVMMHNRSRPKAVVRDARLGGQYLAADYVHLMDDVTADLEALVARAVNAGVARSQIILDPGIGFGKTVTQNLALLNHLDTLKRLGCPILIGPSRKSFIGRVLDVDASDREEGTAAAVAIGIARGANIVRVHDVGGMARIARMTDAILRAPANGGGKADPADA